MPPIAGAIAAAAIANSAVVIGLVGAFGASLLGGLASFAINAAFAAKPKSSSDGAAANLSDVSQTLTTLEAAAPWEIVYGQVEKGGKLVFRHATDTIGSAFAAPYDAVIPHTAPFTVTLPDAAEYVYTDYVQTVAWENDVNITTTLSAVASGPAAAEYAVTAGVYTFNEADAGKSVRIHYAKRNVDAAHNILHLVIVWAAHECESIDAIYFDDQLVTLNVDGTATGKYAGHATVKHHLGGTTQEADALLMAEAPDKWTSAHTLSGHCHSYVRLRRNRDLFPGGVPNIKVLLKGKKVYDPRTGLAAWSATASLCIGDYLYNANYGLGGTYGTDIDTTFLTAAANVDEELVNLAAGGTEYRYTCNGVIDTSETPQAILEKMLTSLAGRLVYVGGAWRLRSGAYITPTVTLDEGDARGPMRVKTLRRGDELFNSVKGVYRSPTNHWQAGDFPAVTSAAYVSADNGMQRWEEIDLPFTTSAATAQRIARVVLERIRRQVSVSYAAKLTAYRVEPPETLMLTNTSHGYSAKVFEALEMSLAMEEDAQGVPVFGVNLQMQETDSNVYTWTTNDEQPAPAAPTTSLPDPSDVAPPGVPTVTEELYETTGSSGVKTRAIVTWTPDGAAWRHEMEWALKSETGRWFKTGLINGTSAEAPDLISGQTYLFRVRTVSALQVRSIWRQAEKEIIGLTAAPADVTGFSVQNVGSQGKGRYQWDRAADLDVLIGGRALVRWTPLTAGANWNLGTAIEPAGYPGDTTTADGPLLTGTYMVKFRDSQGNHSANAASFVVTQAQLDGLATLASVTYHPTFAGSKTNLVVTDSMLQLTATTLWDDMPGNMDDWGLLDYIGGIASTGTVTFSDKLDLGSVQDVRLFAHIKSEGFTTNDLWDSRTTFMDDWGLVDGDVVEDADFTLMVRVTDDDPAGVSPTWGEWHTLGHVADYHCRGFEFRADFVSADVTHNRRVSELSVAAKQ